LRLALGDAHTVSASFRFFCRPSPKICNAGPRVALGLIGCLSTNA
jgi:hypothetical protein